MKKIRIFAGPNGSGKSTLYSHIKEKYADIILGYYVNSDEIKKSFDDNGYYDIEYCKTDECTGEGITEKYKKSGFYKNEPCKMSIKERSKIYFTEGRANTYSCAFIAEYCRDLLVEHGSQNFSCETVFSHESKLELIRNAKEKGFQVYLYFVSMATPDACIERVKQRVGQDGHDVPDNKIKKRYERVMYLLPEAVKISDRVFFLSNDEELILFAEKKKNVIQLLIKDSDGRSRVPMWFYNNVIKRLSFSQGS